MACRVISWMGREYGRHPFGSFTTPKTIIGGGLYLPIGEGDESDSYILTVPAETHLSLV